MVRTDLVMKIELNSNLPWRTEHNILLYCIDNNIEEEKISKYFYLAMNKLLDGPIEIDVPDEHVTWMILKS